MTCVDRPGRVVLVALCVGLTMGGCPGPKAVCGDGVCEGSEQEQSCPQDCAEGYCGDATCSGGEDPGTCPVDCFCGNGSCDPTESLALCPVDCPQGLCGNLQCEATENNNDCPEDCPEPICGNGACESGEDMLSCAQDCLTPVCGNATCEPGEDSWSCLQDCPSECGNDYVDNGEACDGAQLGQSPPTCQDLLQGGGTVTCSADCMSYSTERCFACNDGVCELAKGETYSICPVDCGFTSIHAGGSQTCAVRADGTAWCWGAGDRCQVGDGSCFNQYVPTQVVGIENAVEMAVGDAYHNCALLADGSAQCWGDNGWGNLGDGTVTSSATPVTVSTVNDFIALQAATTVTCGVRTNGATWCWGQGSATLGVATGPDQCQPPGYTHSYDCALNPVQTIAGSDGLDLAMMSATTCLLENAGSVKCWGLIWSDLSGGGSIWVGTPDTVDGTPLAVHFDAAPSHGCIIDGVGSLWCWGSNEGGQLGNGTYGGGSEHLSRVEGLPPIVDVAAGGRAQPWSHTCALDHTGHVWCWGYNYRGQLGTNNLLDANVPMPVVNLSNIVQIAAGGEHTCALDTDAALWCWGWNDSGQLGDNTTTSRNHPVLVQLP